MSSVVCQGLRSCLKPRLIEPIVLRHKLTPPIPIAIPLPQQHHLEENSHETNHTDEEEDHNNNKANKKDESGGWSFLNSLANPSQISKQVPEKTEKAYVHPMVKSFASTLSSKSLEMCTESLGSETGSDISESSDEFCSVSWEKERLIAMRRARQLSTNKKVVATSSCFPPPLTSISGSEGVRVKPHREGGRLVIKAVSVSSCGTNFQAERTNGRLKLSLIKDCSMKCQFETAADQMEEKEEEESYIHEEKDGEDDIDNCGEDEDCHEEEEEEEEEEEDDDDDDNGENGEVEEGYSVRDMEGNVRKIESGTGIGEISRPSRCKEGGNGNKGIPNWGSFWVAIS